MKIAIDIGHNCYPDIGAIDIGNENVIVMDIGKKVASKLEALGYEILVVTPDNADSVGDSLAQRVDKANGWGADLYVSLHENAGGGHGCEIWIGSEKSRSIAKGIINEITSMGFKNRGIKVQGQDGYGHLYVLNYTEMPALLIEGFFIDNASDMNLYDSIKAEGMAQAIVRGLTGITISEQDASSDDTSAKELQQDLNSLMNAGLEVDGVIGYATQFATRNFQRVMHLEADGIAGADTLSAINQIKSKPLCTAGSTFNYAIRWIQWELGVSVDGVFGTWTLSAVKDFQTKKRLTSDGVVGPMTWAKLFE